MATESLDNAGTLSSFDPLNYHKAKCIAEITIKIKDLSASCTFYTFITGITSCEDLICAEDFIASLIKPLINELPSPKTKMELLHVIAHGYNYNSQKDKKFGNALFYFVHDQIYRSGKFPEFLNELY